MPSIQLPKTLLPPSRIDPKVLILYGPPKTGKSTICAQLPNHLLIDCEAGAEHLTACKLECPDLGTFDTIAGMIKAQNYPYRYVIVDTIDKIEEWCEAHATKTYKTTLQGKNLPPGQSVLNLPMGGGYLWLRQSFNEYFDKISKLAKYVIMIGHIRDKMIDSAGKEVTAKDLDLTGKIKSIACSKADAIGYFNRTKDGKGVYLTFETQEVVNCGSRCDHLRGKKFEFENGTDNFNWKLIYKELENYKGEEPNRTEEIRRGQGF